MTTMEHSENVLADTLVNRQNAGKRGPAVGRFLTDPGFFAGPKDHSAVRRIAAAHDVRVDALDQADEKVLELRTLLESPVPERPSLEAQDLKKAVASAAVPTHHRRRDSCHRQRTARRGRSHRKRGHTDGFVASCD